MVDHRGTLTPAEHAALEFLMAGPADLGPRTEEVSVRPLPRLWDEPPAIAAAKLADAAQRAGGFVRTIEAKVARRLAGRGWVLIDAGGIAAIRAHRLAKPLPGGPGDGNAVVCSCGEPFASWADAEAHQAAQEGRS